MDRYLVIIEPTATGATRPMVEREMREAIEFHLDGMRQEGIPIPCPQSEAAFCEVTA
jgi:predicted RNase H-like HicB family nuclease